MKKTIIAGIFCLLASGIVHARTDAAAYWLERANSAPDAVDAYRARLNLLQAVPDYPESLHWGPLSYLYHRGHHSADGAPILPLIKSESYYDYLKNGESLLPLLTRAMQSIESFRSSHPNNRSATVNLAYLHLLKGEIATAVELLDSVIDPEDRGWSSEKDSRVIADPAIRQASITAWKYLIAGRKILDIDEIWPEYAFMGPTHFYTTCDVNWAYGKIYYGGKGPYFKAINKGNTYATMALNDIAMASYLMDHQCLGDLKKHEQQMAEEGRKIQGSDGAQLLHMAARVRLRVTAERDREKSNGLSTTYNMPARMWYDYLEPWAYDWQPGSSVAHGYLSDADLYLQESVQSNDVLLMRDAIRRDIAFIHLWSGQVAEARALFSAPDLGKPGPHMHVLSSQELSDLADAIIGRTAFREGDFATAMKSLGFEDFLKVRDREARLLLGKANIYESDNPTLSESYMDQALELKSFTKYSTWRSLAYLAMKRGAYTKSSMVWDEAFKRKNTSPKKSWEQPTQADYIRAAKTHMAAGYYERAEALLTDGMAAYPGDYPVESWLMVAAYGAGDLEAVVAAQEKTQKFRKELKDENSLFIDLLNGFDTLAKMAEQQNNDYAALRNYELAWSVVTLGERINKSWAKKQYQKRRPVLEEIFAKLPVQAIPLPKALYWIGRADGFIKQSDYGRAATCFLFAKNYAPVLPELDYNLALANFAQYGLQGSSRHLLRKVTKTMVGTEQARHARMLLDEWEPIMADMESRGARFWDDSTHIRWPEGAHEWVD